jgi:hypothetical protein
VAARQIADFLELVLAGAVLGAYDYRESVSSVQCILP